MSGIAVRFNNVSVWYGETRILWDVNLEVPERTIFAVMGPSGSGKSTLLRTVNRLVLLRDGARVSGKVEVMGHDVYNSTSPDTLARLTGMVFQTPNPFPHLSIYDNVAIGPRLHGLARGRELERLVRWALERAALWDEVKGRLREPAFRLSGGQQQRLCIARALALKPKILLLDEPTASLDPVSAGKVEEVVKELKEEVTVILVTHDPGQAERLADRGVVLFSGRIVWEGAIGSHYAEHYRKLIQKLTLEARQAALRVPATS